MQAQPSILVLSEGQNGYLRATGAFSDGTSYDLTKSTLISYSSDTPSVATVQAQGIVTAVAPGSATITVTYGTVTFPVSVTVPQPVNIAPASTALYASQTQQFIAQTTAVPPPSINWSVSPAGVGSISSAGLYTAPSSISAQQPITITAANAADNTQFGTASVTLFPPVSVSVAPSAVSLEASQTQQFTAAIANSLSIGAYWSISPSTAGSIDGTGFYTAPTSVPSQQVVTVTAASWEDPTASGTATIALTPPTVVSSVTSTTANGVYTVGATINVSVTFSKAVNVTGTPLLSLNSGGTASYVSGSGTATLSFLYTLAAGQNSARLDATSNSALTLNGGTIMDGSGTAAILTLPTPGAAGSLSANTNIVIDTTAPQVVSYSVDFGIESYNLVGASRTTHLPWSVAGITVVFSKPIATANTASLGGISATGFSGLGTNTLTWTFGAITNATLSTSLAGSGANAVKDAAGNGLAGGAGFSQAFSVLYGDFNGDGAVAAADLLGVTAATRQSYNVFADINGDGVVNMADANIVKVQQGAMQQ
jgi:hypothetical protein